MATRKQGSDFYRYGAQQSEMDDVPEGQTRWYAIVYGPKQHVGDDECAYCGTSHYSDKSAAVEEAHAWCRDRGFTAIEF